MPMLSSSRPLWQHVLLYPERIERSLERVRASGIVPVTPNLWQIALGVARMWHRVVLRPETIGTSGVDPVRASWRARALHPRPLRFPFLLAERAVAPLDFSGLASSPERVIRHLLGAHHDGAQFVYDLALLSLHPGRLDELVARTRAVVEGDDPRAEWLRDLVVFEGYHERLLTMAEQAAAGELALSPELEADPDITLSGYLRWCARQPLTPEATVAAWRRGELSIANGWSRAQSNASTWGRALPGPAPWGHRSRTDR